jgi:hypothetical protein
MLEKIATPDQSTAQSLRRRVLAQTNGHATGDVHRCPDCGVLAAPGVSAHLKDCPRRG